MDRRTVLTTIGLGLLTVPLAVEAQTAERKPRVGYISPGSSSNPVRARRFEAFREGLRELGYVEGKNIILEPRWADGQYARYAALTADLIRLKPSVIATVGGTVTKAATEVTRTVPIVMSVVVDPVGSGLVPSLAHPDGNVTGTSIMATDLAGKHFELIKEVAPRVARVALLWNPTNPSDGPAIGRVKAAAESQTMQLQALEARDPREIDRAFAAISRDQSAALVILPDAIFTNQVKQLAELAAQRRLPSIYGASEYAAAGGLMSYSTSLLDLERRAATFVDKILRGAKQDRKGARPHHSPIAAPASRSSHPMSRHRRGTDQPEQLPLPTPSAPKSRHRNTPAPEQAVKAYIARRAKPSVVPGHVKLTLTRDRLREVAERLSARAIRDGVNPEVVVVELLRVVGTQSRCSRLVFHCIRTATVVALSVIASFAKADIGRQAQTGHRALRRAERLDGAARRP